MGREYLAVLGVDQDRAGQELGSRSLEEMFHADARFRALAGYR